MFSTIGWALAKITTNIAAPEHFGPLLVKKHPKLIKFDQAGMSKFLGLLFFRKKNRRRPPGSEPQGVMVRPIYHQGLVDGWPCLPGLAWPALSQVGQNLDFQKWPDWDPHGSK